jgi:hypothetical protein
VNLLKSLTSYEWINYIKKYKFYIFLYSFINQHKSWFKTRILEISCEKRKVIWLFNNSVDYKVNDGSLRFYLFIEDLIEIYIKKISKIKDFFWGSTLILCFNSYKIIGIGPDPRPNLA